MCTWAALLNLINGYNIDEDLRNVGSVVRPQIELSAYKDDRPHALQDRVDQFTKEKLIK